MAARPVCAGVVVDDRDGGLMTRPTITQIVGSMWANRPGLPEMLGWTALVLICCWATGWPLVIFGLPVALLLAACTLQMALADLRKTTTPMPSQGEGGGFDAAD